MDLIVRIYSNTILFNPRLSQAEKIQAIAAAFQNQPPNEIHLDEDTGVYLDLIPYFGENGGELPRRYAVNLPGRCGFTLMHAIIIRYGRYEDFNEVIEWLLGQGLDLNQPDESGMTPLHYALQRVDDPAMINFLLERTEYTGNISQYLKLAAKCANVHAVRLLRQEASPAILSGVQDAAVGSMGQLHALLAREKQERFMHRLQKLLVRIPMIDEMAEVTRLLAINEDYPYQRSCFQKQERRSQGEEAAARWYGLFLQRERQALSVLGEALPDDISLVVQSFIFHEATLSDLRQLKEAFLWEVPKKNLSLLMQLHETHQAEVNNALTDIIGFIVGRKDALDCAELIGALSHQQVNAILRLQKSDDFVALLLSINTHHEFAKDFLVALGRDCLMKCLLKIKDTSLSGCRELLLGAYIAIIEEEKESSVVAFFKGSKSKTKKIAVAKEMLRDPTFTPFEDNARSLLSMIGAKTAVNLPDCKENDLLDGKEDDLLDYKTVNGL